MNRILIKCPATGKLVFTGFAMDRKTFESSPIEQNAIPCPARGKEHEWQKKDAIFEAEHQNQLLSPEPEMTIPRARNQANFPRSLH